MASIYVLEREYADLLSKVDESGEIPPDLAEQLECIAGRIEKKIENVLKWLKNTQAEQQAVDIEFQRLKARLDMLSGLVRWQKDYLMRCLEILGLRSGQFGIHKVRIQANSQPTVLVTDLDAVPHAYDKTHEREVSLSQILEDMKAGKLVPGVELKQGQHIRIQ